MLARRGGLPEPEIAPRTPAHGAREADDFTPLEFAQRYTGTFSPDGQRIDGHWESAQDGVTWELDFHLNYTKVG